MSLAALLGLLTLVQEDAAAVAGALFAAGGFLDPWAAFATVFAGIWGGDVLLYFLGFQAERRLLQRSWARRYVKPVALARGKAWFTKHGLWLMVGSRFIPGTRVPAYLAAGALGVPLRQFLWITGAAVAVWTALLFLFVRGVWSEAANSLVPLPFPLVALVLASLLLAIFVARDGCARPGLRIRRWARFDHRSFRRIGIAFLKLTHWEFWPAWLFYLPVGFIYAALAIRYRGWTLPSAANPGMFTGGLVGESKFETLRELQRTSPDFVAEAFLIRAGGTKEERASAMEALCCANEIDPPFILKPDVGQRGAGVKLIRSIEDAQNYVRQTNAALILQRYAPGPREAGIFYYRYPGQERGRILAITEKMFPELTGDGWHTIEELVWRDPRARFQAATYLRRFANRRSEVLPEGSMLKLVESGNHAQGCVFLDGMRLWTETLERRLDETAQQLDGFFIGRFDLRYASEEELQCGRGFQIVELNGAASEATSIYDPRNTLLAAYRALYEQWNLVFAIGAENRRRGFPPASALTLVRAWRETASRLASCPTSD